MNWTKFQTYNMAPEKAFEVLCNQLFENWCQEEYKLDIDSFSVVNGAGGDGGVESYLTLVDGSVVGMQAKWFREKMSANQVNQIKKSIKTAMKVRPEIVRYVVCIPRDLSSKTARGEKTEDVRWNSMISAVKDEYPFVTVELWNETRIVTELQKGCSSGIYKFWFENAEISTENISYAFEKAKSSWLSTKYVPELNTFGEMAKDISLFLGEKEERKELLSKFKKALNLCTEFLEKSDALMSIYNGVDSDFDSYMIDAQIHVRSIINEINKIIKLLKVETVCDYNIDDTVFSFGFDLLYEFLRKNNVSYKYHFHLSEVTKTLKALSEVDIYDLLYLVRKGFNKKSLLFIGDPGTGKTHGISAFSEKILMDGVHIPLLLQARDIPANYTWKDMIVSCIGLSSVWGEEEIWQGLVSMINRHRFNKIDVECDIQILPKVIIIVDGLDESSTKERWIERIKESNVITSNYPQIRFCFTTRPSVIDFPVDYAQVKRLNTGGDTPVYKLFDAYIKKYNIVAKNQGWLRYALTTPLALKLFCELNTNKTISHLENVEISLTELWRRKIDKIEDEFCEKERLSAQNQYVLKTIVYLSKAFIDNKRLEREKLIGGIASELQINRKQAECIIGYLEQYGVLSCNCELGTGMLPNCYYYYPGIQGYFDYATAMILLEEYVHPQNIDFGKCMAISDNTLYALAIVSMQKYDYLITRNKSIKSIVDAWTIEELQYFALRHTNRSNGMQFVKRSMEIMAKSADGLVTIVNRLVLPLSRELEHPLGVFMLNDFLMGFERPAQRDILWSVQGYLRGCAERKWYQSEILNLEDEEYVLTIEDVFNGCPTIYAWALSCVNNSLRKKYRDSLMKWAQLVPNEFWKLFLSFARVNDPQIQEELFSILACLVYEGADAILIKEISDWIADNILNSYKIDENRDIAIRYYSIAIMRKAESTGILSSDELEMYLPPYSVVGDRISLNKDALNGTRMGGYSAISYDLARYVLIDHIESDFNSYYQRKNKQFTKLIDRITDEQPDFKGISVEQFILSAAYAYILDMGWNESEFYNHDKNENGQFIGGVDDSIRGTFYPATHGEKSSVMTICEKYVWQARKYISGFLCDRLSYGDSNESVYDYGMLENFLIPVQEMKLIDTDNIPEDRPWHIPEKTVAIVDAEHESAKDVIRIAEQVPDFDWKKWIIIDNSESKYKVSDDKLLGLSSYSCFYGSAGVETCLFINSVIIDSSDAKKFIDEMSKKTDKSRSCSNPTEWSGGIESSCYISPKEICWFPWKKRYDSYNAEKFSEIKMHSAVDECTNNDLEYGEAHYCLPSAPLREMLGICDSNGYEFIDQFGNIKAEYSIAGEKWGTFQDYLLVPRKELMKGLEDSHQTMVWIMMERRMESGFAKEKYGEFYIDRIKSYIGYFDEDEFRVREVWAETKLSDEKLSR